MNRGNGVRFQQVDNINGRNHGTLRVDVTTLGNIPINNARISISVTGSPENVIEHVVTNSVGQTDVVELDTPPIELSLDEGNTIRPYAEYTVNVEAEGFENAEIEGVQVLAEREAIQSVNLQPVEASVGTEEIEIPEHTLYGFFPPKIAEEEVKPISETGEIVLTRIVIPEYIVVHDGVPTNKSAKNYWVKYPEYIKNVASSEIYATWPQETLIANILAIMSFTMNRVYTEWYRGKGYDFTITSSTAYDQKYVHGRNIFENLSEIVDGIFNQFLARPNIRQPIMTQYCDGKRVKCPKWLSQWGSKSLGDQGRSAIEIIRHYYGQNMYISSAEQISGVPISFPGYSLDIGASGDKVRHMQEQLARISQTYSLIPTIVADGIYGPRTAEAVRVFQRVFNLPQTGVVDFRTWYKISQIYVGVTRIAELM